MPCVLQAQGYESCGIVYNIGGRLYRPCELGLRVVGDTVQRLIYDIVLSRPEDYLSIYQSVCNHTCLKCHSWYFAQNPQGRWMSPRDVLNEVLRYRETVTVWEPRERATMWHASDLCSHCGYCKELGEPGPFCPRKLKPEQVVLSPQGYGPARNIVSFTGGDLFCQPRFYVEAFKLIKREAPDMWIHIETNGYGLTRQNLELLYEAGLDSIWLDLKAFREDVYRFLTGTTNKWVLEVPAHAKELGIVVEIVLLYIPGMVELDQMQMFAEYIASVDPDIPVMLLAFFPEYLMINYREPTFEEMVAAYRVLSSKLHRVRVGNVTVFCRTEECIEKLIDAVGRDAVAL